MTVLFAVTIGVLYAAGLYLVMRRNVVKLVLGLALLGHAANLLIFTVGRLSRDGAPIISPGAERLVPPHADPVPQALVLTAIVIGFGVQAFALVLVEARLPGDGHRRPRRPAVHRLMRVLVVLPVLVPLATAIACMALRPWRAAGRAASVRGAPRSPPGGGGAPPPRGRRRHPGHADGRLAGALRDQPRGRPAGRDHGPLTGITGLAVAVYSLGSIDAGREAHGYHPLFHVLLMGVSMAFLTGDLFNLYVAFEVMLMASFVLLALGGERAQLEGAVKYVTLNLLSSAVFLAAVGVLYGVAGTLNMADLALAVQRGTAPGLVTTLACLFLVAFGIKAAVFPLFFWLPASYHTPPVAVSALFAGLLTKVGVYALVRAFTLVFTGDTALTHGLILAVAVLTMVTGVLGAAAQFEFRRVLSFHIVSQIGYMVLGLGLFTPLALAGTVFYLIHHIVVKTNLFLVGGIVKRLGGTLELGQPRRPLPRGGRASLSCSSCPPSRSPGSPRSPGSGASSSS